MLNLAPLEMWILLQITLEALLVFLMVIFLLRLRKLSKSGGEPKTQVPQEVQMAMERFITESEKLSHTFNENLKQKKDLSVNLLLKLERRINDMNDLLAQAEKGLSQVNQPRSRLPNEEKANPAAPENRALVIKLAGRGLSVEEIARKTRLHHGEVELILDLEKQFNI